jgi:hypothetical protein
MELLGAHLYLSLEAGGLVETVECFLGSGKTAE